MKIGTVCLKLRAASTRFENRIAGAAELAFALSGSLTQEMAFVIQLSEAASANTLDSGISQKITERFGVIVALANDTTQRDITGLTAYDSLFDIRAELFSALLGWQIPGTESLVSYAGSRVLGINRAYLWHQFEFDTITRIDDDDGIDIGRSDLPDFDTLYAQWLLAPNAKLPVGDIPIDDPDMTSIVDFTDDPRDGSFGSGFGIKFDVSQH